MLCIVIIRAFLLVRCRYALRSGRQNSSSTACRSGFFNKSDWACNLLAPDLRYLLKGHASELLAAVLDADILLELDIHFLRCPAPGAVQNHFPDCHSQPLVLRSQFGISWLVRIDSAERQHGGIV